MVKVDYPKTEEKLFVPEEMMSNQCTCSNCTCKCVSQFSEVAEAYSKNDDTDNK